MLHVFRRATLGCGNRHRVTIVVVTFPHASGQTTLLEVVDALNTQRTSLGFCERRQQHGRQNRDNCDNYEQYDEGERSYFTEFLHIFLLVIISANSLRILRKSLLLSTRFLKNF